MNTTTIKNKSFLDASKVLIIIIINDEIKKKIEKKLDNDQFEFNQEYECSNFGIYDSHGKKIELK